MARGGYQAPQGPRPPSGPGKFSQRTDTQTPGLDDPSVQYGDVSAIRAAMSAVPIPSAGKPTAPQARPGVAPSRPMSRAGGLPDFIYQGDSARPNEPGTEGLSSGPGAGPEILPATPPDDRVTALRYLYQRFGNQQALEMANQITNEIAQTQAQSNAPVPGRPVGY